MVNGVVTFCFEGDTDDAVQETTERIIEAVENGCPGMIYSVSEDVMGRRR